MTDLKQAAQQALEALEEHGSAYLHHGTEYHKAITALRKALEQPVQEQQQARVDVITVTLMREGINKHKARELADHFVNFTLTPPLPVQEPVAYDKTEINSFVIDLYDEKMKEGKHGHYEAMFHCVHQAIARVNAPAAQPEQRKPLDDWDIDAIRHNIGVDIDSLWARKFARAIEAAHDIKEKNNG
jgi:hypothetical protein